MPRSRRVAAGARARGASGAPIATLALLLCASIAALAASPAGADPAPGPGLVSSSTPGALAGGSVPDGTRRVAVRASGGGGGSPRALPGGGGRGGAPARIAATFAVLPLQTFGGSVGGGGQISLTGGVGGGGNGGTVGSGHPGAGGGGRTVVDLAGQRAVVAGGGGGGGAAHQSQPAGNGGAAGAGVGAGSAGAGANGSDGFDAPGTTVGGGQGGQVAGGGGGSSTRLNSSSGGGGGGGSSWVTGMSPVTALTAPTAITGSLGPQTPGPSVFGVVGADGQVELDWLPCLYDLRLTKSVATPSAAAGSAVTWTVTVTNSGPDQMTRGDTIDLTDSVSGASTTVLSVTTSGGSNANLTRGPVTCSGVAVGSPMPASTTCSRAYAAVPGTPELPAGGLRGLDPGEALSITYEQTIPSGAAGTTLRNTATVKDRPTQSGTTDITGDVDTDTVSTGLTVGSPPPPAAPGDHGEDDGSAVGRNRMPDLIAARLVATCEGDGSVDAVLTVAIRNPRTAKPFRVRFTMPGLSRHAVIERVRPRGKGRVQVKAQFTTPDLRDPACGRRLVARIVPKHRQDEAKVGNNTTVRRIRGPA